MAGADGSALELTRVLHAPPERVFAAVAEAETLRRWWGPSGFTIPSLDFEPRPGRAYRIEMQPPEGDAFFLAGEFREVARPHRLSFTFRWEDPDPDDVENLVTLTLADRGGSTGLVMRQGPFRTEARRALHRDGWGDSLDKLEALFPGQTG